ncbi:MAG: phage tail family protein [Oscillospiraceae bacterium]|nr:phage tail family protein [Oscillospiraceae bacterium]MBQ9249922.1 phage tail family protein [Oscillospiraceae bacterium]
MTKNTITIELTCNGKTLRMGPGEDIDITAVTGLESSELDISTSDNALVDGASVDGKKIKPRPIHIEASFRSDKNNPENRAKVIQFFNPKYTGKALITNMGVSRNIEYELEGWTFATIRNMDNKLRILVDLLCPDPYMLNVDNFGKNMANISALFAFPWRVLSTRAMNKLDYPEEARGLMLGGMTMGYRTLYKEVVLANDGDVPTGVQIQFVATRGSVTNPKITNTGTGQYMRVNVVMQQGDILLIDTNDRHQVITLNGVNYYQHIDRKSEPFKLAVGDNYLEYDADENYTNLDVNLFYTPKYLGV